MGSGMMSILGGSILALFVAGYIAQNRLPAPVPRIVGIDLGTTFSCIGVYHAGTGRVEILADKDGYEIIPSVVARHKNGTWLVGRSAVAQAKHNAKNTFYDAKRFIGKSYASLNRTDTSHRYQFVVEANATTGSPHFVVESETEAIDPERVGALIVATLKKTAESRLKVSVTKAVMSVPAEFDEKQRNATIRAAKLAGLDVVRLINEPTAAALAYGLHNKTGVSTVMVVDLGGGTLDVSLLSVQGGMFVTMAMAGNNRLGGQDFNQRLVDHVIATAGDVSDPDRLQKLYQGVEKAKLELTDNQWALINIDDFPTMNITREQFESINADLFLKVLDPVRRVLDVVKGTADDVDEVVLVGGSTRVPRIRALIRDFFGGMEPNVGVNPDLAVTTGVALQAGIIGGAWPLQVSAIERRNRNIEKIHLE